MDFRTDYWDSYLVFCPSWCLCWKALIWYMGECSSVPYLVLLNQKQNYHKKVLKSFKLIWWLWEVTSATHIRNIRQYCRMLRNTPSFLTISCLLYDLKVNSHAQKTCYCTLFELDESSQHNVSLRSTFIWSFHIHLNPPGGVSP